MADEEVIEEEESAEVDVVKTPVDTLKPLPPPKYEVRPQLGERFQAANVKEIIATSMQQLLTGRQYRSDEAPRWAKSIANGVRQKVQDLDMKRYKIVVQCTILEMKGAGVKCGQRCLWDPETDDYVDDLYKNESLFCHTIVYAAYLY